MIRPLNEFACKASAVLAGALCCWGQLKDWNTDDTEIRDDH